MYDELNKFIEAQDKAYCGYSDALREIRNGRKISHWIWYIMPQFRELGRSSTARLYGLKDVNEAREYLQHPVLGHRLREICCALLDHSGTYIELILGSIDAKKVSSCMTLFDYLSPDDVFGKVLDVFYSGRRCFETMMLISQ